MDQIAVLIPCYNENQTIYKVVTDFQIENVIIDYQDRPDGSESKLNTISDGVKIICMMGKMFRKYRKKQFFVSLTVGSIIIILVVFALVRQKYFL